MVMVRRRRLRWPVMAAGYGAAYGAAYGVDYGAVMALVMAWLWRGYGLLWQLWRGGFMVVTMAVTAVDTPLA